MPKHQSSAAAWAIRRPSLSMTVVLGVITAVAAGGSGGAQAASGPHASVSSTAAASAVRLGGTPTAARSLAGTWKLLPKAPVTRLSYEYEMTAVWTGHEMITHGNYFPPTGGTRGATFAYRPATRTWARLANSPSSPSEFETTDAAVWTGSRMLVIGQTSGSYNPATNTWHAIAGAGMSLYGAVTGWTGHRFFVWGGTCCLDQSHDGVVYNPASNTWRKLPTAPLSLRRNASGTWTGRELVVAGGLTLKYNPVAENPLRDAAAYNPATGKWRKIAPMPRREYGATAVWDGREILFIGGQGQGFNRPFARGLAYNPRTNRWWLLPAMAYPRSGFAAVWTGRQLLVWGGLTAKNNPPPHGEAYTPAAGKWAALPASPLRGRAYPVAVWTGRQMIVWGGSIPNGTKPPKAFTDGAMFTPGQ